MDALVDAENGRRTARTRAWRRSRCFRGVRRAFARPRDSRRRSIERLRARGERRIGSEGDADDGDVWDDDDDDDDDGETRGDGGSRAKGCGTNANRDAGAGPGGGRGERERGGERGGELGIETERGGPCGGG
jgi:hypothetical protein